MKSEARVIMAVPPTLSCKANIGCILTVDGIASALVQVNEYPGLYVTKEAIPGTRDFNSFPMSMSLDPTTKVALTLWQHEATDGVDSASVGSEYLDDHPKSKSKKSKSAKKSKATKGDKSGKEEKNMDIFE